MSIADLLETLPKRAVKMPDDYYDTRATAARDLAFTVTGVARLDAIQRVLDSLDENMKAGGSFRDWKKAIRESGEMAQLPAHRVELVFRNHSQTAYAHGRCRNIAENAATRPYLMYSAVGDSRTRPAHLKLDGVIRPVGDSFWQRNSVPNGHNCILPGNKVRGEFEIGLKSFYSGKAVKVFASSGRTLSVTANHPVLTGRGWIPANEIKTGDKLLGYSGIVNAKPLPVVNNNDAPAFIEEVFESLRRDAFGTCDRSSFEFHGDIDLREGEIYVSGAKSKLMNGFKPLPRHFIEKLALVVTNHCRGSNSFIGGNHNSIGTPRFCIAIMNSLKKIVLFKNPTNLRSAASNFIGNRGFSPIINRRIGHNYFGLSFRIPIISSLPRCGALTLNSSSVALYFYPLKRFSLTLRSSFDPISSNDSCNSGSALTKPFCNFILTFSRFVSLNYGNIKLAFNWLFRKDSLSSLNSSIPEKSSKQAVTDSILFEELSNGESSNVFIDYVIGVRDFSYSGHVYDLQSSNGLICVNGIFTHNCRCSLISLTEGQAKARGGITENPPDGFDAGWDYSPCTHRTRGDENSLQRKAETYHPKLRGFVDRLIQGFAAVMALFD